MSKELPAPPTTTNSGHQNGSCRCGKPATASTSNGGNTEVGCTSCINRSKLNPEQLAKVHATMLHVLDGPIKPKK